MTTGEKFFWLCYRLKLDALAVSGLAWVLTLTVARTCRGGVGRGLVTLVGLVSEDLKPWIPGFRVV